MGRLEAALGDGARAVTDTLAALLPEGDGPEARVCEAMRYATLGGGKRLRPFLVLTGARLFGVPQARALRTGAAVEIVHCYSLVHDDLPAMDDDDLRRGKPSCHVRFDDATAVLAGDALQSLAFEVLADAATHPEGAVRAELVAGLARAIGTAGMVGGQMFDIAAETMPPFDLDGIRRLQAMKTGALITFAGVAGAILAQAPAAARAALEGYASDLGLAFQIADDLLDTEGSEQEVGKKVGKDAAAGKATFVSLLGVEGARAEAHRIAARAVAHLDLFVEKADLLRDVARFVVERRA